MKEKKERAKRLPTFAESITPIVAMLLILTIGKGVFGYSTEPLLIMVAAIAAFIAFRVGITWDEMMDEICTKIAKGMPAISPMATAPTRMEIIACTLNLMIKSRRITSPAKAAIISLVGSRAAAVVVVILITLL